MSDHMDVNPLPPGWDSKYDSVTGKRYFINYFTRNTSLEDPRLRQRHFTENIPMQDLSKIGVERPVMGVNAVNHLDSQMKATSLEQSVAKISAMFPTVGETHIKTLLLKYLKSVFPVVEETLLLDTLCNSDNNVHQATETLVNMGFDKRATPPPRVSLQKREVSAGAGTKVQRQSPVPPRMKSVEEKEQMKIRLRVMHPDIEERVISIALDSVDYSEDKADQILNLMKDERKKEIAGSSHTVEADCNDSGKPCPPSSDFALPVSNSNQRSQNEESDLPKAEQEVNDCESKEYRSRLLTNPVGPNKELHQGPNDGLLLSDYVAWTGPNQSLAKGPDKSNIGRSLIAWGPNPKLRKGPMRGLAKGSIYSRLSKLTLNETRGK